MIKLVNWGPRVTAGRDLATHLVTLSMRRDTALEDHLILPVAGPAHARDDISIRSTLHPRTARRDPSDVAHHALSTAG